MNEFDFNTMKPQVALFCFIFWKKLKSPKRHFEINWPLPFPLQITLKMPQNHLMCRYIIANQVTFLYLFFHAYNKINSDNRLLHIFFHFSKAVRQFVWLFTCFVRVEIVFGFDLHSWRTISCSQFLQNTWIKIVAHWNFLRKYVSICIIYI